MDRKKWEVEKLSNDPGNQTSISGRYRLNNEEETRERKKRMRNWMLTNNGRK
jgi:hypothetical protein